MLHKGRRLASRRRVGQLDPLAASDPPVQLHEDEQRQRQRPRDEHHAAPRSAGRRAPRCRPGDARDGRRSGYSGEDANASTSDRTQLTTPLASMYQTRRAAAGARAAAASRAPAPRAGSRTAGTSRARRRGPPVAHGEVVGRRDVPQDEVDVERDPRGTRARRSAPSARSGAHQRERLTPFASVAAQPERQRPPDRRSMARRARSAARRRSAAARAAPCGPRTASRPRRRSASPARPGSPPAPRRTTPRASARGCCAAAQQARGALLAEHVQGRQRRPARAGCLPRRASEARRHAATAAGRVARRLRVFPVAAPGAAARPTTARAREQQGQRQDQRERPGARGVRAGRRRAGQPSDHLTRYRRTNARHLDHGHHVEVYAAHVRTRPQDARGRRDLAGAPAWRSDCAHDRLDPVDRAEPEDPEDRREAEEDAAEAAPVAAPNDRLKYSITCTDDRGERRAARPPARRAATGRRGRRRAPGGPARTRRRRRARRPARRRRSRRAGWCAAGRNAWLVFSARR